MSDTTGWIKSSSGCYIKLINGYRFLVWRNTDGIGWYLTIGDAFVKDGGLRELQRLANETARLWAGETE